MPALEQPPPLHPVNVEPLVAVAVNVTVVPTMNAAVQLALQLAMPPGELLTVPLPVPMSLTVRDTVLGGGVKVADTVCAAFMTSAQEPVPVHAPDQPAKVDPAVPVAVRVTEVPLGKSAPHVLPQLTPAGVLVTTPSPLLLTVNSAGGGGDGVAGAEGLSEPAQADKRKNSTHVAKPRLYICCPCRSRIHTRPRFFLTQLGKVLY